MNTRAFKMVLMFWLIILIMLGYVSAVCYLMVYHSLWFGVAFLPLIIFISWVIYEQEKDE